MKPEQQPTGPTTFKNIRVVQVTPRPGTGYVITGVRSPKQLAHERRNRGRAEQKSERRKKPARGNARRSFTLDKPVARAELRSKPQGAAAARRYGAAVEADTRPEAAVNYKRIGSDYALKYPDRSRYTPKEEEMVRDYGREIPAPTGPVPAPESHSRK
jgi:hypothetical protein